MCEALLDNGIAIEHACDMSCACTTCHVIVREGLPLARTSWTEDRRGLAGPGLGAGAAIAPELPGHRWPHSDLTVEIPRYTINHARENH